MKTCIYPTLTDDKTDAAIIHVWCSKISDRYMTPKKTERGIRILAGYVNNSTITYLLLLLCVVIVIATTGRYDR